MSEDVLDLRRAAQIVWRHIAVVSIVAAFGLAAGVVFALAKPPMRASTALVLLPPAVRGVGAESARYVETQLVVAVSNQVLADAAGKVTPPVPVRTLRSRITVSTPSADIIAFTAQGTTAAQAETAANAMASSYVTHLRSPGAPDALVLQRANFAAGTSLATRMAVDGGLGIVLGAVAGSVFVLAVGRGDRRLRHRDEIADATGVPVLASIPVPHVPDAAGWARLLDDYEPDAVQAWSLRRVLQRLGITDGTRGNGGCLAIVSLSSDHRALALGPQVATFAASLGVPTTLILSQEQGGPATAALRAACSAPQAAHSSRPRPLRVRVEPGESADIPPGTPLNVIVDVVDAQAPRVARAPRGAGATVLGVSAGAATAEELARVVVSIGGRGVAGILLADPDPADETTGLLPQLAQPRHLARPSVQ